MALITAAGGLLLAALLLSRVLGFALAFGVLSFMAACVIAGTVVVARRSRAGR